MTSTTFIYALCEPGTRTVRYIGKADDVPRRLRKHLNESARQKNHLGNWLRAVLARGEKPALVILREVSYSLWKSAEKTYIRIARGLGKDLVNSTDGGEGITMTAEIRAKIGAAHLGRKLSTEVRAKMCIAQKGRTFSPEARAKMSATRLGRKSPMLGRCHSPAARAKMSSSKIGRRASPEHRARQSAAQLGGSCSQETRKKIAAALTGRKRPSEACENMRLAQLSRHAKVDN